MNNFRQVTSTPISQGHTQSTGTTASIKSNILYKTKHVLIRRSNTLATEKAKILYYVQAKEDKYDNTDSSSFTKGDIFAVIEEQINTGWLKVVKVPLERVEYWNQESVTIKQKQIYIPKSYTFEIKVRRALIDESKNKTGLKHVGKSATCT